MTQPTTPAAPATFTAAEATDEAWLMLSRKLRRLHPEAFADVWAKLSEGATDALGAAERRADAVRFADEAAGTSHDYAPRPELDD